MSETGDGLDHLRIPFEKIKFGKKLEVQGYGTVFEGESDGQRVALKQLNITNLANIKPQLLAEILTISRFRQHPNLVALLGFCDEKSNEIILVYEYVASGNLADKMRKRLTTIQRFEICLGAARGLDYLHTGDDSGIVHGNIKLSKILLNSVENSSKFEAKVSSFGLSKIVPGKAQVAAEATKESDVYSFGVLLLEVLCGVSELVDTDDYQERHVTELVPKKMQQNKLQKVVQLNIRKEIKPEALETYAKIACQCVMEDPDARPKMAQLVEELEKALRLQGGEVTYVQIPGCSNVVVGAKDDTVVEDGSKDGVTVESNIHENEPEVANISTTEEDVKDSIAGDKLDVDGEDKGDENDVIGTVSESINGEKNAAEDIIKESVPNEDAKIVSSNNYERETLKESNITVETENKEEENIPPVKETEAETTEETIMIIDSNNITKPLSKSDSNSDMGEKVSDAQFLASLPVGDDSCEMTITEEVTALLPEDDATKQKGNGLMNSHMEEIKEADDGDGTEFIVTVRCGESENNKRSNSNSNSNVTHSSESSNGDDNTPSDYLLPDNVKKTSQGNCGCCICSCWQFIYDRVVLFGGLFWNKLVSCFNWITCGCSSKKD